VTADRKLVGDGFSLIGKLAPLGANKKVALFRQLITTGLGLLPVVRFYR